MCQQQQARFIVSLLGIEGPMTLAIDRTNWKFGEKAINILMLSVQWNGKAIPLFWQLLDKEGNSNQEERIGLLQLFLDTFGEQAIYNLTADREFIGRRWFQWLIKKEIPFDIRIKSNTIATHEGRSCPVWELSRRVKRGNIQRRNGLYTVYETEVYLSGGRPGIKREKMVISSLPPIVPNPVLPSAMLCVGASLPAYRAGRQGTTIQRTKIQRLLPGGYEAGPF